MQDQNAQGKVDSTPNYVGILSSGGLSGDLGKGTSSKKTVVIASSDLFINDAAPQNADAMASMLFDQLGAQELSQVARLDSIRPILFGSGSSSYSPVKDLNSVASRYNPQKIVGLQGKDLDYFSQFPISLWDYVPRYGGGPNGSIVYIDSNSNLAIEAVNILEGVYYIEIEMFTVEEVIDDTIYMEEQ